MCGGAGRCGRIEDVYRGGLFEERKTVLSPADGVVEYALGRERHVVILISSSVDRKGAYAVFCIRSSAAVLFRQPPLSRRRFPPPTHLFISLLSKLRCHHSPNSRCRSTALTSSAAVFSLAGCCLSFLPAPHHSIEQMTDQ
jgi:hypothetical protein